MLLCAFDEVGLRFFAALTLRLFLLLAAMQLGSGLGRTGDIKRVVLFLPGKVGLVTVDLALLDGVGVLHL